VIRLGDVGGGEGNELIVIPLAEVPQPNLIKVVDSNTSSDGIHEYCVLRGGRGKDIRDVDFQEIAFS
jgi:hypothetical protein